MSGRTLDGNTLAAPLNGDEKLAGIQSNTDVTIIINQITDLINRTAQLGSTAQVTGLVTALAALLPLSGGTMTGNLILNGDATQALQAVTYQQFQGAIAGFNPKASCYVSTTSNFSATYNNGSSGVGATLTATSNGVFTADGVTPPVNSRIFVPNQTAALQNGMYVLTNTGSVSSQAVLTRASDFDNSPAGEVSTGSWTNIQNGTTLGGTQWYLTTTGTITIGTTNLNFSQTNFPMAGTGLTKPTPNTLALDQSYVNANTQLPSTAKVTGLDAALAAKVALTGTQEVSFTLQNSDSGFSLNAFSGASVLGATSVNTLIDYGLTANSAVYADGSKQLQASPTTATQLGYLSNVTSDVQTQLNAKQATSAKDASGGYVGLTLFKINFKNVLNTFTSFFTNSNTAARTYTFQDRDGTIADDTDLATKLTKSSNLSDLTNTTTARSNLGLGSLATLSSINNSNWSGTVLSAANGGTGVNNGSNTITLAGNLATSGANSLTLTTTGATNVTLPTSGTLTDNNLSNVNASTGRTNLGLGNAATQTMSSGTFTSAIASGGLSSIGGTINWIQITTPGGNIVHYSGYITWGANASSTNVVQISLPFALKSTWSNESVKMGYFTGVKYTTQVSAIQNTNNSYFTLWKEDAAGGAATQLKGTDFLTSGEIDFSGTIIV